VVVQLKQAPVMAIQPTGEEVAVATVVAPAPAVEVVPEPAPAPVAVAEPTAVAAAELPQTSSRLPLIALLGLLALGAGLALRRV
jgi:LPXTG-motif cell wall-anchored protein